MTLESSGTNSPIIPVDLENAICNRRCILLTGCGLSTQIPFRAYFATNYDTFLEQAFLENQKYTLSRFYEGSIADAVKAYGGYFENKQPFILKLHGDIKKPDSLLLGDRDFKRLKEDAHSNYKRGLKQLLLASSVLCIGFEKTDHDLECLLTEAGIVSKTHIDRRNRYWSLVAQPEQSEEGDPIQDKRIEFISCPDEEVVDFFERLLGSLQSRSGPVARIESDQGVSGTDINYHDNQQPEREVSSQADSPLNSTNSTGKFIDIYVSYAEKDLNLWEKLDKQLESMKEWITVKDRTKVAPGKDEKTEIKNFILHADIALFMVSPEFTTSKMCQYEVEEAMKRRPELYVIPVILRPVDWENEQYKGLQPLPRKGNAISVAKDQKSVFYEIAKEIRKVVEQLRQVQKLQ